MVEKSIHHMFFSQKIASENVVFFQGKFEPYTHTQFQREEKKPAQEKKNTIFTNTPDFFKKVAIFKLFPGKKKIRYLWVGVKF